jgi:hypothetical protein
MLHRSQVGSVSNIELTISFFLCQRVTALGFSEILPRQRALLSTILTYFVKEWSKRFVLLSLT